MPDHGLSALFAAFRNPNWMFAKAHPTAFGDNKNQPQGKPMHRTNTAVFESRERSVESGHAKSSAAA